MNRVGGSHDYKSVTRPKGERYCLQHDRSTTWSFSFSAAKRGESAAFEELVRGWERRLFFYVRRLVATEEDAWQILQEVWLQVLRGIRSCAIPRDCRSGSMPSLATR